MSVICPTVLASDSQEFGIQIEKATAVAGRIQIDLMDGEFAPAKSINPIQSWWPDGVIADMHLMFRHPGEHLETLVSLKPNMVIFHAEADGDISAYMSHVQKFGIKAGVALLKDTTVQQAADLITVSDHVLVFSGNLGKFGGSADLTMLNKVGDIRAIRSDIEIGWDGGASTDNVRQLVDGGIDVINVGGAIQKSADPKDAYAKLEAIIRAKK